MFRSKWLATTVLVAAAGALSANQAQAHGDAAAVLVGVAVGGLTTYALQNAGRHGGGHHHHHHHHHGYQPPQRVEHYVIHNPPQYYERGYERVSHRGHRGHHGHHGHRGGGYEYEYEYSRRGGF